MNKAQEVLQVLEALVDLTDWDAEILEYDIKSEEPAGGGKDEPRYPAELHISVTWIRVFGPTEGIRVTKGDVVKVSLQRQFVDDYEFSGWAGNMTVTELGEKDKEGNFELGVRPVEVIAYGGGK